MQAITVNIEDLKWRKTQNRLVGKGSMRYYDQIHVVGETRTVIFERIGPGTDPHKKRNGACVIFKPNISLYDSSIAAITLYVH